MSIWCLKHHKHRNNQVGLGTGTKRLKKWEAMTASYGKMPAARRWEQKSSHEVGLCKILSFHSTWNPALWKGKKVTVQWTRVRPSTLGRNPFAMISWHPTLSKCLRCCNIPQQLRIIIHTIFLAFWYETWYTNCQFLFLNQPTKYHFPVTSISFNFLTSQLKYLQHYEINNYNLHAHIF